MRALALTTTYLVLSLAIGACATGARAQSGAAPASLPPLEPPRQEDNLPAQPDVGPAAVTADVAGAEADFQLAASKHLAGDRDAARSLAAALRNTGPLAIRERASALEALALLEQGDAAQAQRLLAPGSSAAAQTNFLAGVAAARLGQAAAAWTWLGPLLGGAGAPPVPGLAADRAAQMLAVAGAESAAGTGRVDEALTAWQRFADGAQPFERVFALRRAEAAVSQLPEKETLAMFQRSRTQIARTVLAAKAAVALAGAGQADEARRVIDAANAMRLGFDSASASAKPVWAGTGDPGRFGLSVPLSGKGQALGMALTRGAVVAIGALTQNKDVAPLQIMVRDTTGVGGPVGAAAELAREEAVLGVVGVPDLATVEQMTRDGVPYLLLGGAKPGAQSTAFQLVHDNDARVRALAQLARGRGFSAFAILAPDTENARRSAETFRQAVSTLGGQIAAEVKYTAAATSFTKEVEALKKQRWEVLFVPDGADKLELIAPALAVADLWPQATAAVLASARDKPRRSGQNANRRNILLLSTAPGASKKTLARAGRYIQGALVAPGYYPDPDQASAARFVAEFSALYGHDPGASDAYGFDGVHLLRSCVDRGARSRADVLRMLGAGIEFQGVTGIIRFGTDHGREGNPLIYEVSGDRFVAQP